MNEIKVDKRECKRECKRVNQIISRFERKILDVTNAVLKEFNAVNEPN